MITSSASYSHGEVMGWRNTFLLCLNSSIPMRELFLMNSIIESGCVQAGIIAVKFPFQQEHIRCLIDTANILIMN